MSRTFASNIWPFSSDAINLKPTFIGLMSSFESVPATGLLTGSPFLVTILSSITAIVEPCTETLRPAAFKSESAGPGGRPVSPAGTMMSSGAKSPSFAEMHSGPPPVVVRGVVWWPSATLRPGEREGERTLSRSSRHTAAQAKPRRRKNESILPCWFQAQPCFAHSVADASVRGAGLASAGLTPGKWRRGRDLNPRTVSRQWFSRPPP